MPMAAPPGARASRFAASSSMGQRTPSGEPLEPRGRRAGTRGPRAAAAARSRRSAGSRWPGRPPARCRRPPAARPARPRRRSAAVPGASRPRGCSASSSAPDRSAGAIGARAASRAGTRPPAIAASDAEGGVAGGRRRGQQQARLEGPEVAATQVAAERRRARRARCAMPSRIPSALPTTPIVAASATQQPLQFAGRHAGRPQVRELRPARQRRLHLQREHQEAAGEQRDQGEHVEVHPVGAGEGGEACLTGVGAGDASRRPAAGGPSPATPRSRRAAAAGRCASARPSRSSRHWAKPRSITPSRRPGPRAGQAAAHRQVHAPVAGLHLELVAGPHAEALQRRGREEDAVGEQGEARRRSPPSSSAGGPDGEIRQQAGRDPAGPQRVHAKNRAAGHRCRSPARRWRARGWPAPRRDARRRGRTAARRSRCADPRWPHPPRRSPPGAPR